MSATGSRCWRCNETYGEKNVVCSGPVFKKMKIEGGKAVLDI